jgi:hypothetical protein
MQRADDTLVNSSLVTKVAAAYLFVYRQSPGLHLIQYRLVVFG